MEKITIAELHAQYNHIEAAIDHITELQNILFANPDISRDIQTNHGLSHAPSETLNDAHIMLDEYKAMMFDMFCTTAFQWPPALMDVDSNHQKDAPKTSIR